MVNKKERKKTSHKKSQKKVSKTFLPKIPKRLTKSINLIVTIVLILGVMFVGYYVRSGPIHLRGMDQIVKQNVYYGIKADIANHINQQYPHLDSIDKEELTNKKFQEVLISGSYKNISLEKYISANLKRYKGAFQANNGQTYLNAIDPYHFLKFTDIYNKNGYVGTELKDGHPWVDYKLAPIGVRGSYKPSFQVLMETFMYKLYGVTYKSTDGEKMHAIYLIPIIFVILAVLPFYFFIKRYSNDFSAFLGGLFLMTIGIYVSRTIAGFVDTDAYNVFFPLLIIYLTTVAVFESSRIKKYIFYALSALSQSIYLFAWGNGWFILIFLLTALISLLAYKIVYYFIHSLKVKDKGIFLKEVWHFKNISSAIKEVFIKTSSLMYEIGLYLVLLLIFGYIVLSSDIYSITYNGLIQSLNSIGAINKANIWPNVLSSVAELNPASLSNILSAFGGEFVFILSLFGLLLLISDFKTKNEKVKILKIVNLSLAPIWFFVVLNLKLFTDLTSNLKFLYLVILVIPTFIPLILSFFEEVDFQKIFYYAISIIWFVGTMYMAFRGVRFILLLAPVFAVLLSIMFYYIYKYVRDFLISGFGKRTKTISKVISGVLVLVIFLFIFVPQLSRAITISDRTFPNFDDNWFNSMYKIKNASNSNAIITSWWDFGHFFAAVSDRGVTFDGGSQATPRAYWVGKLLLESHENVSVDILRMLVCGGNEAFNTFYSIVGKNSADAVKINKILGETFGKSNKRAILMNNGYYKLSNEEVNQILKYLDCKNPPEDFLITSGDMIAKAGVWAHWGSWNFSKKYIYDHYKLLSVDQIAKNIDVNRSIVQKEVNELKKIDYLASKDDKNRENLVNRWLAPYPSYIPTKNGFSSRCAIRGNSTLACANSLVINTKTGKILSSGFNNQITFRNLYFPINRTYIEKVEQSKNGRFDVLLTSDNKGLSVIIMEAPLGDSLFTKLFFLNGEGTQHFQLFDRFRSAVGFNVNIWKVNFTLSKNINSSLTKSLNVSNS